MSASWGPLLQRGAALALVAFSLGFFVLRAATGADIPFVFQSAEAPWIEIDLPVGAGLRQWGRADPVVTTFERRFLVRQRGESAAIVLRAPERFEVELNGTLASAGRDPGQSWREETRVDVGPLLRDGPNEIRVRVSRKHGPGLLSLRSEGFEPPLRSDAAWLASAAGNPPQPTAVADDTRQNPEAFKVETPAEAVLASRNGLIVLGWIGALAFLGSRKRAESVGAALPLVALLLAGAAWIFIFARKFSGMPLEIGFDARHHVAYVHHLRQHGVIPLPTDGWSTYHPPFFYAAAAALEAAAGRMGGARAETLALKAIPFLAGFGVVAVTSALCRRIFPGDAPRRGLAIAFAAVLPMMLYSAAYFSNETLTAFLIGVALLFTVDLLLAERAGLGRVLALACVLGLGLLTKYTAFGVAAVAGFFVLAKLVLVERVRLRRVAGVAAILLFVPLLLAGGFYLRNLVLYGDPFMANWGHMPGLHLAWWQQPGFHTSDYYTQFGRALTRPYLAGFVSFWDSYYATLWGDGGIAGRVAPWQRHRFWNYDFMSAGYLLALPATLLMALGAWRWLFAAFRDPDPGRRAALSFLLTFVWALVYGLVYLSLRLPYFAQAKASYALAIAPVLSLLFASGVARCDALLAPWTWARALFYAWLAAVLGALLLSFAA